MSMSKTCRYAVVFTAIGFIFALTAMAAPYWLQNDGEVRDAKFQNLGLWEVCFTNFYEPHYYYDEPLDGCGWIFDDDYQVYHELLLPTFFVAVQYFFTICFTLCLISAILLVVFLMMPRDNDFYIMLLLTMGTVLFLAAVCALIAVIIFGARGDGRDWMPHWEHNDMGWAYAVAVLDSLVLFPAGILFLIEARRIRYKRLNEIGTREASAYSMDDRKSGHTDI